MLCTRNTGIASQFITGEVLRIGLPYCASGCLCSISHQLQGPHCYPGSESSNSNTSSYHLISWITPSANYYKLGSPESDTEIVQGVR